MKPRILLPSLVILTGLLGVAVWHFRLSASDVPDLRSSAPPELAPTRTTVRLERAPPGAEPRRSISAASGFAGIVVDEEGQPIEGAEMWRAEDDPRKVPVEQLVTRIAYSVDSRLGHADNWRHSPWHAVSDGAGRFEFRIVPDQVNSIAVAPVTHERYAAEKPWWEIDRGEPATLRMRRTATCKLIVRAVDATSGAEVPEFLAASVGVREASQGNEEQRFLEHADLGQDGRIEIERFPFVPGTEVDVYAAADGMGDFSLPAEPPATFLSRAEADHWPRQSFLPVEGGRYELTFQLILDAPERAPDARVLEGLVLDASNAAPIRAARVHPIGQREEFRSRAVMTGADGRFRIAYAPQMPSGTYAVHHADYVEQLVRWTPGDPFLARLVRRPLLRGTVTGPGGRPLPGVPLLLRMTRNAWSRDRRSEADRRATSDHDGRFEFARLFPGEARLHALSIPNGVDDHAIASRTIDLAPGEVRELTFELDPPDFVSLRGRVHSHLPCSSPLVPLFFGTTRESNWVHSELDPEGNYSSGKLTPGPYLVIAGPPTDDHGDCPYTLLGLVEVEGFGERTLDFTLPRSSLRGRLAGAPLPPGARMLALPARGLQGPAAALLRSSRTTTLLGREPDPDGHFELPCPDGEIRLVLQVADHILAERTLTLSGTVDIGLWTIP